MRHIAIITTSLPDGEPGSESAGSFVEDFSKALSEHAHVTVVAPTRKKATVDHQGNLTIRRFIVPRQPLSTLTPYNPSHWLSIFQTLHAGWQAVDRLVNEEKVDHIFSLWVLPSGYWARKAWKRYGIPYSTWALGSDIWSLRRVPVVKGLLAKVLKDSYACFADGYALKQDVERISGRSCDFLASARRLPLTTEKKLHRGSPYRLAFLGRWHPNKGVDMMLDSIKMLSDQDWQKIEEVRIHGGGPLDKLVMSECDSLKKAGRPVTAGGYLGKAQAAELLNWADYLLIPSRIESIPVVFSDAMQAGCTVVATPVGDLPRLMGDHNVGILADGVTAEAFAEAIHLSLSAAPMLYHEGMIVVRKQFDVAQSAERMLDFLFRKDTLSQCGRVEV